MANFYFTSQITGTQATFTREEFHHAVRVMRRQVGDRIRFLDGRGGLYRGLITEIDHHGELFRVEIEERRQRQPRQPRLTLAVALPRRKKLHFIIQKATELGVSDFIPLYSDRSCVRPFAPAAAAKKTAQWQKIALEAAKQCGNPCLPVIHPPLPLAELPAGGAAAGGRRLFLHPGAPTGFDSLAEIRERPARLTIAVGPEGGFTAAEAEYLTAGGFTAVSLGDNILRLETAVVAAVVICQYLGGHLSPEPAG
ncbi:MAG: 16S rRNA (uracil(1498)-N(3))-methyltransferase [Deltaproteobacteria bacterium]|nr:16S rRNA (uracil(1498)-N(3))-methyltransferase [Deltaproteobacteria bacterium]